MNNLNTKVYLIGGFLVNDNYGDVVQAKVWVDLYKKNNILFKLICYEQSINKCRSILKLHKNQVISIKEFLSVIDNKGTLHLYGGGYMNNNFGEDFLIVCKHANRMGFNIFATGVQIDKSYYSKIKSIPINYISVRDSKSKKIVNNKKTIITDDSLIYFYNKRKKINFSRFLSKFFNKQKILLQLSLNSYIYDEGLDLVPFYKDFITNLFRHKYKVTLVSSFPKTVDVVENQNLLNKLEIDLNNIDFTTTQNLEDTLFDNYDMIVVNSFHTYIMSVYKYNCPIYYLAFSNYYKQKALGLKNYGLLKDNMLIDNPKKLGMILSQHNYTKSISKYALLNSFRGVNKVLFKVKKLIVEANG